ncbi:MAG: hypothetical protein ACFE0S_09665 [Rhodospirillales bacterium]
MLLPYLTVIWMVIAAVGGGLTVLRGTGLLDALTPAERLAMAFVIGIGLIGWLAFFPGLAGQFNGISFAVILAVMSAGLIFLRTPGGNGASFHPLSALEWSIVGGIAAVMLMDFAEGLSPAADGDTMAYHFETPQQYLAEGAIFAIPRAIDGVSQLLLQMTYGVAQGLGGKPAVPLWTMVSGWGLGALFYVLARRHMNRLWALIGTLCLMTTPAVIYSSGSGHAEVRAASFALLGAYAAAVSISADAGRIHRTGWLILAGLCAGFFANAKVTGLIFAFAACISMFGTGWLRRTAIFSLVAAATGTQWHIFNWSQTGDPLYPLLWQYADIAPGFDWGQQHAAELKRLWSTESPLPKSPFWFVLYPFRTVFFPPQAIESLRTGIGPMAVICLPFAVIAAARARHAPASPLFRLAITALIFYAIWFFFGPSQRIRHLIPIYPIAFLCILAGTAHFADGYIRIRTVLVAGAMALLAVQFGGQIVFSKKFVDHVMTDQSRSAYLNENIGGYPVVEWLNGHLNKSDRVFVTKREWLYWLEVPYYFAHNVYQTRIALGPAATDVTVFLKQLHNAGITHVTIRQSDLGPAHQAKTGYFMGELLERGCLLDVAQIPVVTMRSRTLPGLDRSTHTYSILRIRADECRIS